ncbi:MAG TPA: fructose-bisphosphatase class II, partial [Bacillota bacterium]|nr:fructose-bisphosphatase class II [Bacillota bacterium]
VATAFGDTGVDMLLGIGGAPEGVLAAAALRCLGGEMQGILKPIDEAQAERARGMGLDLNRVLTLNDLVPSEDVIFAATGITDGDLLKGVRYFGEQATSHSIVMRSRTGTIRLVEATHRLDRKTFLGRT